MKKWIILFFTVFFAIFALVSCEKGVTKDDVADLKPNTNEEKDVQNKETEPDAENTLQTHPKENMEDNTPQSPEHEVNAENTPEFPNEAVENRDAVDSQYEIFQKINNAVNFDNQVNAQGRVAYQNGYYYSGMSPSYEYTYGDLEKFAVENEYVVEIVKQDDVFGFDNEYKLMYRYLFVGDAYNEYVESNGFDMLANYGYLNVRKNVEQSEKDGVMYVASELDMREDFSQSFGIEMSEGDKIKEYLELDANTYEILKLEMKMEFADGSEALLLDSIKVTEPEAYEIPEEIINAVFSQDLRTVTLVELDENGNEVTRFTQTIGKGGYIDVIMSQEYDKNIYSDMEFTNISDDLTDCENDFIGYIRKNTP